MLAKISLFFTLKTCRNFKLFEIIFDFSKLFLFFYVLKTFVSP